jgi:hypothetical protein
VALAAASVPIWLELSLLTECHRWTALALASLDAVARDARQEILLQAAFGISRMFTMGMTDEAHVALTKAADLAAGLDDIDCQLRVRHGLWAYDFRIGNYQTALAIARHRQAFAASAVDPIAMSTADRMLGTSLHVLGDQVGARTHLERALAGGAAASRRAGIVRLWHSPCASCGTCFGSGACPTGRYARETAASTKRER